MKKLFCILLTVLMLISLVSCDKNDTVESEHGSSATRENSSVPTIAEPATSNVPDDSTASESEPQESTKTTEAVSTESATEESTPSVSDENAPQDSVTADPPQVATYVPRVMMYHLIRNELDGVNNSLFVRPAEFEAHLILLNELGFEYIFADDWKLTETPSVMLTFDDGYVDNYTNMFPLLKQYGAKATIFLISGLIDTSGYLTSDMIKEMSASGLVSFQCHTTNHYSLSQIDVDSMHNEFKNSCNVIESLTGKDVKALAYPMGEYNSSVISVASEYFDFAYTVQSPFYVKEYTKYTIPRYFVRRGDTRYKFNNYLK